MMKINLWSRPKSLWRLAVLAPVLVVLAGFFPGALARGQARTDIEVPFASTPNPVGSGGRAVAWGGAFIAIADDATAASWNPGGLIQLIRPEASVVLSYHTRSEDMSFGGYDTDTDSSPTPGFQVNYASVVYPFNVAERNMVVSLNYQRLYEFDRDLEYTASGTNAQGDVFTQNNRIEQSGALTTLTPAFCAQITPAWSLGFSVNFWGLEGSGDGWKQRWQYRDTIQRVDPALSPPEMTLINWKELEEEFELSGTNFVIGTHYKIQNWTLGAVYKTSLIAEVDYKAKYKVATYSPTHVSQTLHYAWNIDEDEELVWPESYGFGVAYRYSDHLSFAVDAYTSLWSHYKLKTDSGDINLLTGDQDLDIKDTWQVRAGAEYLWILPKYVFALRGGGFYDPEPLADEVNEFYGLSLGGGLVYRNFLVDAAFQYRWANDTKSEIVVEGEKAEFDVNDYFAIVSLIYHF